MVNRMFSRLHRVLATAICLVSGILAGIHSNVSAEDWAFRRSYYSHDLEGEFFAHAPLPVSRSAYRIPYVPNYPGATVYSSWRLNRVQLRSGSGVDTQYLWQGTVEIRP